MNHILAGSVIPFLVAAVFYLRRGGRASARLLFLTPLCMFLGAVWAVLPDVPRIVGWHSLDQRLASTNPWIDVFFWHYTINCHENASPWFSVAFVSMVACLFIAGWRELRLLEES